MWLDANSSSNLAVCSNEPNRGEKSLVRRLNQAFGIKSLAISLTTSEIAFVHGLALVALSPVDAWKTSLS